MMNHQEPVQGTDVQLTEPGTPQLTACTFNVGDKTFSVPLEYVQEITEVSEISPLPLTPSYIDGIVHLRGSAIPVINMGRVKDIAEEQKKVRQLIVLDLGSDKFGIVVNEMPDLNARFSGELINVKKFYETYRITK